MFKSYINLLVFSAMVSLTCLMQQKALAQSATDAIQESVAEIAEKIVSEIDTKSSFAVSYNKNTAGSIPESLIEQVGNIVESELLIASGFELNLTSQSTQEQAWENSIEFNNADFDEIFKNSKLDGLIIVNTRAVEKGLEISLKIISLAAATSGQTIASSGSKFVSLDWAQFSTVDLTEKTAAKIARIQEAIEKLRQLSEPIQNPTSFAEFIHNAKLYQKDGKLLDAIQNYELAIIEEPKFVDIILDMSQLLITKFGVKNAEAYLNKRIYPHLDAGMYHLALLEINPKINQVNAFSFVRQEIEFAPLAAKWLWSEGLKEYDERDKKDNKFIVDYALLTATRLITRTFSNGEFQNFFLDPLKAKDFAKVEEARAIESKLNRVQFSTFEANHKRGSGYAYYNIPPKCWYYKGLPTDPDCAKFVGEFGDLLEANPAYQTYPTIPVEIDLSLIFQSWLPTKPCHSHEDWSRDLPDLASVELPIGSIDSYRSPLSSISRTNDGSVGIPRKPKPRSERHVGMLEVIHPTWKSDRMIFADWCLRDGESYGIVNGISGLLITDDVDRTKPVLLTSDLGFPSEEKHTVTVDITKDGTAISPTGFQVEWSYGEGMHTVQFLASNDWFFVPGIVQSLVGRKNIQRVNYTDTEGNEKTIFYDKIMEQDVYPYIEEGHWSRSDYKGYKFEDKKEDKKCAVVTNDAKITNVQNFTNLRRQAGLNGQVIAQVPLEATVSVVNPGNFLRTERCAAACNGANQNAIKQCVDNNDVWIEVEYNGTRGFLSRKFLE